jgi:hypothetical protein
MSSRAEDPDRVLQRHLAKLTDDSYPKWNKAYEVLDQVKPDEMERMINYLEPRNLLIPQNSTYFGTLKGWFSGPTVINKYDPSVYQEKPFKRALQVWREYEESRRSGQYQYDQRQRSEKQAEIDAYNEERRLALEARDAMIQKKESEARIRALEERARQGPWQNITNAQVRGASNYARAMKPTVEDFVELDSAVFDAKQAAYENSLKEAEDLKRRLERQEIKYPDSGKLEPQDPPWESISKGEGGKSKRRVKSKKVNRVKSKKVKRVKSNKSNKSNKSKRN